jgi:hypothetical protein
MESVNSSGLIQGGACCLITTGFIYCLRVYFINVFYTRRDEIAGGSPSVETSVVTRPGRCLERTDAFPDGRGSTIELKVDVIGTKAARQIHHGLQVFYGLRIALLSKPDRVHGAGDRQPM